MCLAVPLSLRLNAKLYIYISKTLKEEIILILHKFRK